LVSLTVIIATKAGAAGSRRNRGSDRAGGHTPDGRCKKRESKTIGSAGRLRSVAGQYSIAACPLPDLPDSYVVSTVRGPSVAIEYGTSKRADAAGVGVPVLRMGNIPDGQLKLDVHKLHQIALML